MSTPLPSGPDTLAEGRFRLLEVIGEGGMATVYRALDLRLQRPRAIKILSPELSTRPSLRRRFLAEAQTMATLEESRVVRVFDTGEEGDRVYIVMELVEGGSLLDRVRDFGPLPPRMAAEATIQICESLQVAHDAGIIHRDIKPHNILLTRTGEIRVTDFGIAQVQTEDGDGMTRTGAVMGTWGFMAPEQKTNAKQVDVRADVYSIGATLWSLLRAETPPELFMADAEAGMLDEIPEALGEVIRRATRYRRDERYLSARDMAASIRALLPMLPEDPELTVPLVGHTLDRPGKPLDTMHQFTADSGTTGVKEAPPARTMVPDADEPAGPAHPPEAPEAPAPSPASLAPASLAPASRPRPPEPAPRRAGAFVLVGGGAAALGTVATLGVLAVVFFLRIDAPVAPPNTVPPAVVAPTAPVVAPVAAVPPEAVLPAAAPPTPTTPTAPAATATMKPVASAPVGATAPVGASVAVVDAVVVAPVAAPAEAPAKAALRVQAPSSGRVGESLAFTATLPDPGWTVKVYYRPASGGAFDNKAMNAVNGTYTASVKVTDAMVGGVSWFVSATKGATTLKEGSQTSARSITIAP
jgi:serine/threonine-protein kinase